MRRAHPLTENEIGEFGERKEIRPVTISTYQMITAPKASIIWKLFDSRDLATIYDEALVAGTGPGCTADCSPAASHPATLTVKI